MTADNVSIQWGLVDFEIKDQFIDSSLFPTETTDLNIVYGLGFTNKSTAKNKTVIIDVQITIKDPQNKDSPLAKLDTSTTFLVEDFDMAFLEGRLRFDFFFDLLNNAVSTSRGVLFTLSKQIGQKVLFPTLDYEGVKAVVQATNESKKSEIDQPGADDTK